MMRAAGLGNEDAVNFLDNFVHNLLNADIIPEDGPTYHAIRGKVEWIRRFLNLSESNRRLWKVSLENFLVMSSHRKSLQRTRFDEAVYSLMEEMENAKERKILDLVQRGLLRTALQYSPRQDEVWWGDGYRQQSVCCVCACVSVWCECVMCVV